MRDDSVHSLSLLVQVFIYVCNVSEPSLCCILHSMLFRLIALSSSVKSSHWSGRWHCGYVVLSHRLESPLRRKIVNSNHWKMYCFSWAAFAGCFGLGARESRRLSNSDRLEDLLWAHRTLCTTPACLSYSRPSKSLMVMEMDYSVMLKPLRYIKYVIKLYE